MSLQARKSKIYLFIAGAAVFGALMFYSFGGRRMITHHESFKMYFTTSVNGLVPGSRVTFKGVPFGYVQSVILGPQQEPGDQPVPVTVNLDLNRLRRQLGVVEDLYDPAVRQAIIDRGLRAQLKFDSYVTGAMYIDFDYYPKAPPPLPMENAEDVIPTIPSEAVGMMKTVEKTLQWLPKQNFADEASRIANDIDSVALHVQVIPFAEFSQRIQRSLRPLSGLNTDRVRGEIDNVAVWFDGTNRTLGDTNGQLLGSTADFFRQTASVGTNLASFNRALGDVRSDLQPRAPWRSEFEQTLQRLSAQVDQFTRQINAIQAQPSFLYPPVNPPREFSAETTGGNDAKR